ncbi:unnamed protein product [Orchesella dallaii]|uniref:Uncharacterized protein n=1 Tax=Orchesella dallaii TaxID=48710 RepID=A0ABP1Q7N9_9HEXA
MMIHKRVSILVIAAFTFSCLCITMVPVEAQGKRKDALCYTCLNNDCQSLLTTQMTTCTYSVNSTFACMTYLSLSREVIARGCGDDVIRSCFNVDNSFLKANTCERNMSPCQNEARDPLPWGYVGLMPDDMLICPCVGDLCNAGSAFSSCLLNMITSFNVGSVVWLLTSKF